MEWNILTLTRNVKFVTKLSPTEYLSVWHIHRKLGNHRSSEGLRSFKPSNGTNLITLLILAGDIEMTPGPRFQCRLCKYYCKASDKVVECEDCEKGFHASCAKLEDNELLKFESGNGSWYCTNCKADSGLCSGAVLKDHKAVQCDDCEMWVHNGCSFISESQYATFENTNCTWTAQIVTFSTFPNLFFFFFFFFNERLNLENQNRFDPLTKEKKTGSSSFGTSKNNFTGGLKFVSININSIRGNKLELLAFFDFHQPHIVAIQETKIATSKLFPESCPYNVYRNGALPHSRKKFIGFITHFSSWSISGYSLTGQTQ